MSVAAENIHVRRGGVEALRGVSAAAEAGALVGLIGPNGSGKSTLLNALAGLLAPTQGRVTLDGRPLADYPAQERAKRVGYMEQTPTVHWPVTVARLVALGRTPHRAAFAAESDADRAAVAAALTRADVAAFGDRPATALSGGERARVMLARVLAGEPSTLLADEPAAGLDPYHQLQVMELLRDLAREGRAVMVVLHDLTLAMRFCDRLILLERGRVAAEGDPAAVLADPAAERVFAVNLRRGDGWVLPWTRRDEHTGRDKQAARETQA